LLLTLLADQQRQEAAAARLRLPYLHGMERFSPRGTHSRNDRVWCPITDSSTLLLKNPDTDHLEKQTTNNLLYEPIRRERR
jgi:hypothetical protein